MACSNCKAACMPGMDVCADCAVGASAPACVTGPGNVPVTDAEYQCSLGVQLQGTIDEARRIKHTMGLRPYRVFLVWVRRDGRQRFQEIKRIELTPVRVNQLESVSWRLRDAGRQAMGSIVLTEVSPAQVTENDLLGRLDGEPAGPDVDFFYEIVRHKRCAEDTKIQPGRYTVAGVPTLDGEDWQYVVNLADQHNPRWAEDQGKPDRDATFQPTGRARPDILRG